MRSRYGGRPSSADIAVRAFLATLTDRITERPDSTKKVRAPTFSAAFPLRGRSSRSVPLQKAFAVFGQLTRMRAKPLPVRRPEDSFSPTVGPGDLGLRLRVAVAGVAVAGVAVALLGEVDRLAAG